LIEINREMVTSMTQMNLAILNNKMANTANQTNMSVKRLTSITTVFMPLTLLAGLGGMSEWTMMTGQENWKIAYPAFLLGMAVIALISHFILKWLGRNDNKSEL
jgi:magnesium transporter